MQTQRIQYSAKIKARIAYAHSSASHARGVVERMNRAIFGKEPEHGRLRMQEELLR
jgi:hypothetical protein